MDAAVTRRTPSTLLWGNKCSVDQRTTVSESIPVVLLVLDKEKGQTGILFVRFCILLVFGQSQAGQVLDYLGHGD